ncbi:MAG: hypothetical protein JWP97_4960 [Labilithrix sp.]|nr:hypothetical protein [Labilithrix sp.]
MTPFATLAGVAKRSWFFRVRVALLLLVLFGVVLWAVQDRRQRRERNAWTRTLDVAIVVVTVEAVDAAATEAVRDGLPGLEARLTAEHARYHPGSLAPFRFRLVGPVAGAAPPPGPSGDGALDLASYAYAQWRWVKDVDARAGVEPSLYDSRIYLAVRRPRQELRTLVEGRSEQGGRVGIVELELDADAAGAHLPLVVATHELLHTLGATDKYDAAGRTRIPDGLAEPAREPRYPQRFAEIMARDRPVSAEAERVPESLAEVAVGPLTAREIGWAE